LHTAPILRVNTLVCWYTGVNSLKLMI